MNNFLKKELSQWFSTTIVDEHLWYVFLNHQRTPHGPEDSTTTCQLHMRKFEDGDTITIEPFRAKAFPVVKDLWWIALHLIAITQAGGFITVRTGSAPDGNALPVPKDDSDKAMDAAACIGCGAALPPAKMLQLCFSSAKAGHLNMFPKDKRRKTRSSCNGGSDG